jgi:TRAP-type C4-dicarboxylate transport system substrate-binding protein
MKTLTIFNEFPEVRQEVEKSGGHYLYFSSNNAYNLISKKPISQLSDLRGLKIRGWGSYLPMAYKEVGAVGVTINYAEAFEALQRGVLDANPGAFDDFVVGGFYEIARHIAIVWLGTWLAASPMINLDVWKRLPDDVKKVMQDVAKEVPDRLVKHYETVSGNSLNTLMEKGIEFHQLEERDKWAALVLDKVLDAWVKGVEAKGLGSVASKIRAKWQEIANL